MRPAIWPTVALTVAAFAIVGWAICAAAIGIGFSLMTEHGALILHAIRRTNRLCGPELGLPHVLIYGLVILLRYFEESKAEHISPFGFILDERK